MLDIKSLLELKSKINKETAMLLGQYVLKALESGDPNKFIRETLTEHVQATVISEKGKLR